MYLEVTEDEYERPLFICDSVKELAGHCGVKPNTVNAELSRLKRGLIRSSRYRVIQIDEVNRNETD